MYFQYAAKQRDLRRRRIREMERKREDGARGATRPTIMTTTLTDADVMPWGKHKGQKLGEVPMKYWRWMIEQDWARQWNDLFAYAERRARSGAPYQSSGPRCVTKFGQ